MMNRSQLTHAPYVQRPPAIVQLKNPGLSNGFLAMLLLLKTWTRTQASCQLTVYVDGRHHSTSLIYYSCVRRGLSQRVSTWALVGGTRARCDDGTSRGRAAEFDPPPHKATVQRFNPVSRLGLPPVHLTSAPKNPTTGHDPRWRCHGVRWDNICRVWGQGWQTIQLPRTLTWQDDGEPCSRSRTFFALSLSRCEYGSIVGGLRRLSRNEIRGKTSSSPSIDPRGDGMGEA